MYFLTYSSINRENSKIRSGSREATEWEYTVSWDSLLHMKRRIRRRIGMRMVKKVSLVLRSYNLLTFKDLKKRVSLEVAEQQTKLFGRLQNIL